LTCALSLNSVFAQENKVNDDTPKPYKMPSNVFIPYHILEEKDIPHFEEFIAILENLDDESLTFEHIVVEGDHQSSFPMTAIRSVIWLSDLIKE
jgi:hypothetical protein